jgi:hypothetical protein
MTWCWPGRLQGRHIRISQRWLFEF